MNAVLILVPVIIRITLVFLENGGTSIYHQTYGAPVNATSINIRHLFSSVLNTTSTLREFSS